MPSTDAEWQEAVDLADFWIRVDAARQYGLITGGPAVDVARCARLLKRGKKLGFDPSPDSIERLTAAFAAQKGKP
jgi:hypothetical protein